MKNPDSRTRTCGPNLFLRNSLLITSASFNVSLRKQQRHTVFRVHPHAVHALDQLEPSAESARGRNLPKVLWLPCLLLNANPVPWSTLVQFVPCQRVPSMRNLTCRRRRSWDLPPRLTHGPG